MGRLRHRSRNDKTPKTFTTGKLQIALLSSMTQHHRAPRSIRPQTSIPSGPRRPIRRIRLRSRWHTKHLFVWCRLQANVTRDQRSRRRQRDHRIQPRHHLSRATDRLAFTYYDNNDLQPFGPSTIPCPCEKHSLLSRASLHHPTRHQQRASPLHRKLTRLACPPTADPHIAPPLAHGHRAGCLLSKLARIAPAARLRRTPR